MKLSDFSLCADTNFLVLNQLVVDWAIGSTGKLEFMVGNPDGGLLGSVDTIYSSVGRGHMGASVSLPPGAGVDTRGHVLTSGGGCRHTWACPSSECPRSPLFHSVPPSLLFP